MADAGQESAALEKGGDGDGPKSPTKGAHVQSSVTVQGSVTVESSITVVKGSEAETLKTKDTDVDGTNAEANVNGLDDADGAESESTDDASSPNDTVPKPFGTQSNGGVSEQKDSKSATSETVKKPETKESKDKESKDSDKSESKEIPSKDAVVESKTELSAVAKSEPKDTTVKKETLTVKVETKSAKSDDDAAAAKIAVTKDAKEEDVAMETEELVWDPHPLDQAVIDAVIEEHANMPADKLKKCLDFFWSVDKNRYGYMTLLDFVEVLKKQTNKLRSDQIVKMFVDLDHDHNFIITLDEYLVEMSMKPLKDIGPEDVQEAFDEIDLDHDGFISQADLDAWMEIGSRFPLVRTDRTLDALARRIKISEDHRIDIHAFVKIVKLYYSR